MTFDVEIDARGLRCPLPVLRLRQALRGLRRGQVARLVADDPMAAIDVRHFCDEQGHALIARHDAASADAFLVRKGRRAT